MAAAYTCMSVIAIYWWQKLLDFTPVTYRIGDDDTAVRTLSENVVVYSTIGVSVLLAMFGIGMIAWLIADSLKGDRKSKRCSKMILLLNEVASDWPGNSQEQKCGRCKTILEQGQKVAQLDCDHWVH
eukprot:CAMPEP_0170481920 /NCGR_PEP_ID=MMETSP0208-20121228/2171_1 /TAXON_ID=197538 /ORGANISM="Strombidium inclinatum, Strain S3" /LENGTH=126 /DNA_ID=CAMNT_0010754705 /DNA_START=378 /DNA_END=758 /DNA_ORIENTATION=-